MYYKTAAIILGISKQLRRLKTWAAIGTFVFALSFCMVFKPHMAPLNLDNMQLLGLKTVSRKSNASIALEMAKSFLKPICNFSGKNSDYCEIKGDVRIHGKTSSIYFTTPHLNATSIPENTPFGIKILARKTDGYMMRRAATEYKLKLARSSEQLPECTVSYTVPCVVFAAGGYTGDNYFHDMTDLMVPLYLTSAQFNGQVQFLFEFKDTWWVKYSTMFQSLSNFEVVDLVRDDEVRCFKSAVIGLKAHKEFDIDPRMSPFGHTMRDFTQFVRRAYSLERDTAIKLKSATTNFQVNMFEHDIEDSNVKSEGIDLKKPRLLLISRKKKRVLQNEDAVALEAQRLGYDVNIMDPAEMIKLEEFSKFGNSFDVMVGVHGAGLTNMIFLPENAVVIQVVPLEVDVFAEYDFGLPARNMKLGYLKYKISKEESSLMEEYSSDDPVFVEHDWFRKYGWVKFKRIYLDKQNVTVDVSRFRNVLLKALELLH